ncbi:hypothetical protein ACWIGI_37770 [Nocardia sp. NPDC055321]
MSNRTSYGHLSSNWTSLTRSYKHAGPTADSPITVLEARHLGGALSRVPTIVRVNATRTGITSAQLSWTIRNRFEHNGFDDSFVDLYAGEPVARDASS